MKWGRLLLLLCVLFALTMPAYPGPSELSTSLAWRMLHLALPLIDPAPPELPQLQTSLSPIPLPPAPPRRAPW